MTETPVRRQFIVPGHFTASVVAESDAEALELLAMDTGDTIDLSDFPIREGEVTITGLDLTPLAAKLDKVGDELVGNSMPDLDFSISDITRLAAEDLEGDWQHSPGAWGVSGDLTSGDGEFAYTLEVVGGTLRLIHRDHASPCAEFKFTHSLREIADKVIAVVLHDVEHG
ncbi:hypothetical protein [Streptomyces anulatus]|uniref:hypothetical protein n=1 Tax=Streptomyces anulatus TaxID=1892 RepID=UPI002E13F63D|nr:hypothetical protein OG274_38310 [Streptomyces anulatus]